MIALNLIRSTLITRLINVYLNKLQKETSHDSYVSECLMQSAKILCNVL